MIKGNGYGFGDEVLTNAHTSQASEKLPWERSKKQDSCKRLIPSEQVIVLTPVMSELREADLVSERVYTVCGSDHLQFLVTAIDELLFPVKEWRSPFD